MLFLYCFYGVFFIKFYMCMEPALYNLFVRRASGNSHLTTSFNQLLLPNPELKWIIFNVWWRKKKGKKGRNLNLGTSCAVTGNIRLEPPQQNTRRENSRRLFYVLRIWKMSLQCVLHNFSSVWCRLGKRKVVQCALCSEHCDQFDCPASSLLIIYLLHSFIQLSNPLLKLNIFNILKIYFGGAKRRVLFNHLPGIPLGMNGFLANS